MVSSSNNGRVEVSPWMIRVLLEGRLTNVIMAGTCSDIVVKASPLLRMNLLTAIQGMDCSCRRCSSFVNDDGSSANENHKQIVEVSLNEPNSGEVRNLSL